MSSTSTLASSQFTSRITQDNPSGMTLAGTNTYVIAAPGSQSAVIVDPGQSNDADQHAAAVSEALDGRSVELILITHHHLDHTGALEAFISRFDAPVRAVAPQWCRDALPLIAGEVITAAGTIIQVLGTPGHTSDSVSFFLPEDNAAPHPGGTVLTGDTILGEGTTMLDYPDGTLDDYLRSLESLAELEGAGRQVTVLPAHGPTLDSVAHIAQEYREHRLGRVAQLRTMIQALPPILTPVDWESVVVHDLSMQLYPQLPDVVRGPATKTLAATLDYLLRNTKD